MEEEFMRSKTQRSAGRHRKITTSQTAKGRLALVTIAAGAVSTAGVGGAAAANLQAEDAGTKTQTVDYNLANESDALENVQNGAKAAADAVAAATPQILAVA